MTDDQGAADEVADDQDAADTIDAVTDDQDGVDDVLGNMDAQEVTYTFNDAQAAPDTITVTSPSMLAFTRGPNRSFRIVDGIFEEFALYPADFNPSGVTSIRVLSTISEEVATPFAFRFSSVLGRLPMSIREAVTNIFFVESGDGLLYQDDQGAYNLEMGIDYALDLESSGLLEEEILFQLAQVKYLDASTSSDWLDAVASDGRALVNPASAPIEAPAYDIASTFVYYWALRYSPDSLSEDQVAAIQMDVPARVQWFDSNALDVSP